MANRYLIMLKDDEYLTGDTLRKPTVVNPYKAKVFTRATLPETIKGHNYEYTLDMRKMGYMLSLRGGATKAMEIREYNKEIATYNKAMKRVSNNLKIGKTKRAIDPFQALLHSFNPSMKEDEEILISILSESKETIQSIEESIADMMRARKDLSDGNKAIVDDANLTPHGAQKLLNNAKGLAKDGRTKAMEVLIVRGVAKGILYSMAHKLQRGHGITPQWIQKELVRLVQLASSDYNLANGILERQLANLAAYAQAHVAIMTARVQAIGESTCLRQRGYLVEGTIWPAINNPAAFARGMVRDFKKITGAKPLTTKEKQNILVGVDKFRIAVEKNKTRMPASMVGLIKKLNTWGSNVERADIRKAFMDFLDINESVAHAVSALDGKTKIAAKKFLYQIIGNRFNGFFNDQGWRPVKWFYDELNKKNIDWKSKENFYTKDKKGQPIRKTWKMEISFLDNKGKRQTLYGNIVAAGAGSVNDPFDKYDMNFTVS